MKPEEAIKILDDKVLLLPTCPDIVREAVYMAIEALEKQIPKKPEVLIDTWLCPTCAEKVEYQTMLGDNVLYHGCYDFCPNCGRAIDWSE